MPTIIEVGNEELEFPDSMTDEEIQSILRREYAPEVTPEQQQGINAVAQAANLSNRTIDLTQQALEAGRVPRDVFGLPEEGQPIQFPGPEFAPAEQPPTPGELTQMAEADKFEGIPFPEMLPRFGPRELLKSMTAFPPGIGLPNYPEPGESDLQAAEQSKAMQLGAGATTGTGELITGIAQYFTSPQGLLELGLTKTPLAPVVAVKWAKDMVEGGMFESGEAYDAWKRGDMESFGKHVALAAGMWLGGGGIVKHGVTKAGKVAEGYAPRGIGEPPRERIPDALQQESESLLSGVRPRNEAEQARGEVPAEVRGAPIDVRGDQLPIETKAPEVAASDFARYNELVEQMKSKPTPEAWLELEAIKNRNGGQPPTPPAAVAAERAKSLPGMSPSEWLDYWTQTRGEGDPVSILREHYKVIQRAFQDRVPINAKAAESYEPEITGSSQRVSDWLMERGWTKAGEDYVPPAEPAKPAPSVNAPKEAAAVEPPTDVSGEPTAAAATPAEPAKAAAKEPEATPETPAAQPAKVVAYDYSDWDRKNQVKGVWGGSHRLIKRQQDAFDKAGIPWANRGSHTLGSKRQTVLIPDTPEARALLEKVGGSVTRDQWPFLQEKEQYKPSAQPEKVVAKVQAEVTNVAKTEGVRPAKEVKTELIQRLEKAIEDAPNAADVEAKYATTARGERYESSPDTRTKLTIDIPGDGTFTVWNTKENLAEILTRAKKLQTTTTPPQNFRTQGIGKEDREWVQQQVAAQPAAPEPTPKAGEAPLESRVSGKGKPSDIFTMEEGDLADLFESRFGKQEATGSGLEAGRPGVYTFPTYDAFRDWMDTRYGERDLEGLKLAFAEAPTANKIRYIKDNLKADAHKRDWISHMATGAPLPTTSPPVVRTTPRPTPTGAPARAPTPPRPGQPPPPPRPSPNAPRHRKFDITALTQLFRRFSKYPTVNERLMRAYGRFIPGTKAVELKARLMWDTKLAERVLGHEIGHFIDLAVAEMGKGKQFADRLIPLWALRKQVWSKKEFREEARSLSRQWRGPFRNGDKYRDTANELFADFMSAMFNDPEMVNQRFPKLFDAFQQLREGKPKFASAYREIETWLQGDTMVDELRVQDKAAVERTFDELQNPKKPSKASFMDRLIFGTMSLWQRAFQKEGKPRELGTSITDELEYNKTWAAKENALWADDYSKTVRPELEKVDSDPIKARAALLSYSKAVRTIGERRAAGKWIEQNPVEARAILERILEIDDSLRNKFSRDLASVGNDGLYDLSAAIFREIHDRGEPFVNRMEREIDALDLGIDGEAALMAFNVRGKLLNPGGLTVENAQKMIDRIESDLGQTRFAALEAAAKNLRDLLHAVQSKMHDEGLISNKTWKELIEPNKDNYLPYAVLDYFDGRVRAGVMKQKGTAKDIADIAAATQLKVASSNVWRQQQRQVKQLRDVEAIAQRGPVPLGERLKRSRDIEQVRARHLNDDVSRAVFWVDGKPHVAEFPGDKGKMLEKAMEVPSFYEHIEWIGEASDMTHKVMQLYTQFSVPFLFWRNPIRGARTAGLKVGFGKVARQMTPAELAENTRLAKNYAEAAFGGEMDPVIRDLVDRQILLPPRLSQAMVRDSANLRDLLANHTILANQVRGLHPAAQPRWWKGGRAGREAVKLSEKVFTGYEAFEKIYNYKAAIEKGLTPEQAGAIARRAGIPKPGVGGKWSLAMEVWFPWTRVHLQGSRATYDILRDPKLRNGFATRFMLTEAMPRVAKVAIGAGVVAGAIKWATSKDEDKDDGVMAEFLRRVSPYKMALDDTVPLYFYDARTGKVHYLWEFKSGKSIPKHYEAISLRIPASEEGRLWGVLLYNTMVSAPGVSGKLGRPGETAVSNFGNWAVNYAAPGLSPIITTTSNLKDMILLGRNPKDAYRNQPAANPGLFDAGGVDRAQAIAGYTLNQLGSAGELAGVMAANFGLLDERALNALSKRLPGDYRQWNEKVPFLKTAVSHDNYAQYREEQIPKLEEERIRAKARLVMSPDARALYDFYYRNINRKDKLTESEQGQFEAASYFVNDIWGNLTVDNEPDPDSFYSKAAHAVGKDGSRQATQTVQRDIDAAASLALAAFKQARKQQ